MNTDKLKSLAKAACDALCAFFFGLIDELAAGETPTLPAGNDPPPPVDTDPPADDGPNDPNGDQPSDSPPPQDQNQGSADTPPADGEGQEGAQPPALATVVTFSTFDLKTPYHPAQGASNVIALSKKYNARWKQGADDPATGAPTFADVQNGGTVILDGCIALFQWGSIATPPTQIWPETPVPLPDGVWSPPNTGTPTPPASGGTTQPPVPPAPVVATPMPPVATGPAEPGEPKDPAKLKAVITFKDATQFTFLGAAARDLGDFVVPHARITQRNLVVTSDDGLWRVFFRPDRDNARVEAIALYGAPKTANPATFDEPYAFQVFYDDAPISPEITAPKHFWLARWRWQSSPRPRVQTPEQLVSKQLVPAYARTRLTRAQLLNSVLPAAIMDNSTITTFMGQTGERFDIGIMPEHAACYMATGDAIAYDSMMQWAEASATGPWHINDDNDGIQDWRKLPLANTYSVATSTPPIFVTKIDPKYPGDFLRPDDAHHPCLSYLPFLSTGDPFHAEELQYQINFYLGGEHYDGSALDPARKAAGGKLFIFDLAQTRGYAWMLRSAVFCHLAADLIQSPTLLPKSFWQQVLDANLKYLVDTFVNGTTPKEQIFGSGTSRTSMGWWQEDYLCGVLGMMVKKLKGYDAGWAPVLDWKLKSNAGRLSTAYGGGLNPEVYYAQFVKQTVSDPDQVKVLPLSERGSQYANLGTWTLTFTDATHFTITDPAGRARGSWVTGEKPVAIGNVPQLWVPNAQTEGKVITWSFAAIETWEELWDVNVSFGIVQPSPDGKMVLISHEYAGSLYSALAASESSLLPAYVEDAYASIGADIPWRDSIAA